MGYISELKVPKSNSNEKSATIFKAQLCEICHILPNFVQNRHQYGQIELYNHYRKLEGMKSKNRPLGNQTCNLAFHERDL